jgi:hypothetical protein
LGEGGGASGREHKARRWPVGGAVVLGYINGIYMVSFSSHNTHIMVYSVSSFQAFGGTDLLAYAPCPFILLNRSYAKSLCIYTLVLVCRLPS